MNEYRILIKQQKYQRAFESAQQAEKLDPENPKVGFRLAQAKIGLGEVNAGKKMLHELHKKSPDVAIIQYVSFWPFSFFS